MCIVSGCPRSPDITLAGFLYYNVLGMIICEKFFVILRIRFCFSIKIIPSYYLYPIFLASMSSYIVAADRNRYKYSFWCLLSMYTNISC